MSLLLLERLEQNDLPLPQPATDNSAGLDLAACLTRPCKIVEADTGNKKEFKIDGDCWCWKESAEFFDMLTKTELLIAGKEESATKSKELANYEKIADKNAVLVIHPNDTIMVPLGWKCSFEHETAAFGVSITNYLAIHVRSSTGLRGLVLANGTGIVDADYRGELFAVVRNVEKAPISIKHGERIVQAILTPFIKATVREGKVDVTARGEGGFGSTGTMTAPGSQL
jgi:deoxyuridine 5'-triphosphate nucleotidohydrolase